MFVLEYLGIGGTLLILGSLAVVLVFTTVRLWRRTLTPDLIFRQVEALAFIFGFVGLVVAVRHLGHLASLEEDLKTEISRLPTRSIGRFPDTLTYITEIIKKANAHFDMLVDIAGYGNYSDPRRFRPYFTALLDVCRIHDVNILIYSKQPADDAKEAQFGAKKYSNTMNDPKFRFYFKECFPGLRRPTSYPEFSKILDQQVYQYTQALVSAQRARAHKVLELKVNAGPFLWISDRKEVIFSIPSTNDLDEFAFYTTDPAIVENFERFFHALIEEKDPNKKPTEVQPGNAPPPPQYCKIE